MTDQFPPESTPDSVTETNQHKAVPMSLDGDSE